ncbi:MAG: hypothetical protein NC078_10770 [Ruminococcus sp.]|nr:hypothetical protein [Ruminococcus sp.]
MTKNVSEEEMQEIQKIYFDDKDGYFGENEREAIKLELTETAAETGWCVGVVTGHSFDSAESLYRSVFGDDGDGGGVLLCINKGYAKVYAVGEAEEYVRGQRAKNIVRLTERCIRHKRYRDIPEQFARRLVACRKKGRGSFDFYPPALFIAVIFGAAAGFGTAFFISRRYSPVEPPIVNNYLDVRSIEVYRKEDTLLAAKSVRYRNNALQQLIRGEGMFKRR